MKYTGVKRVDSEKDRVVSRVVDLISRLQKRILTFGGLKLTLEACENTVRMERGEVVEFLRIVADSGIDFELITLAAKRRGLSELFNQLQIEVANLGENQHLEGGK